MVKVYVKDIHDKSQVASIFHVTRKASTVTKSGKPYLAVTLRDKTGELDARVWAKLEELEPKFAKGDYVRVEGPVTSFQGKPQLRIDVIEKVTPENYDAADFAASPKAEPGERFFGPIVEIVERVHDPHVKALLKSFLEDETLVSEFKRAPAAKSIHHAYPGGLAEHTLSVMKLAQRVADHYPMADRDLLVAGAFLHDLGKLRELIYERQTEYSDEGRLLGHLVITAQWVHDRASAIENFPKTLAMHLMHMVISHHGTLEFGSARLPQTLEAMLLHTIDEMDSRVSSWLELMKRDPGDTWTDFQKLYDRHLYKGASPTINAKVPVERRHRRERQRRERNTETTAAAPASAPEAVTAVETVAAPQSDGGEQPVVAPATAPAESTATPSSERTERGERQERSAKKSAEEKFSFRPFAALVSAAQQAAPTSTPEPATTEKTGNAAQPASEPQPDNN